MWSSMSRGEERPTPQEESAELRAGASPYPVGTKNKQEDEEAGAMFLQKKTYWLCALSTVGSKEANDLTMPIASS